ncbi:S-layer homology domain-containing protein [Acutalibacter sp. 1XD8-36]|nr:S-layer homology domain-containing protein [Acutalibacter sp. 1XD8-36]
MGINVSEGNSLTIYAQSKDESAMGKLEFYGSTGSAGIGGGDGSNGGTITINNGTVTATSQDDGNNYGGAGIGGGSKGGGGSITISGGTVKVSSESGADIGGGNNAKGNAILPSDKIEISESANVTRLDGKDLNIGPVHEANTDEWGSDSTSHWRPCKIENCAENHQFDKADHSFGDWIIDIPATSDKEGQKHRDCNICKYLETETIPPVHSHSYGAEWKSDAAGHWHECSCGDRSGDAPHNPGGWIVDQAATSSTAGRRHRECTDCRYWTQTETIPATGGGSSGGYVPPTYKPDVTQPGEGGSVSVSPSSPKRGDTVTVELRPDEGYELDSITVTDRDGKRVELTAQPDGTYTFWQPSGKVKIEVTYKRTETPWDNPFSDISEDNWYYEAVRFAQEQGLMNGYSDGRFGAEDTLSRAQLAQILFNREGRPGVDYLLDFSDVGGRSWYAGAVRWAASQGIVSGYGNGTFGPNAPITREQLAVMLWRYSGSPAAASKELDFNDESQISGYALEAMRWAVENGILNGYGDGRLGPKGQATRAQAAQILKNFIGNRKDDT